MAGATAEKQTQFFTSNLNRLSQQIEQPHFLAATFHREIHEMVAAFDRDNAKAGFVRRLKN